MSSPIVPQFQCLAVAGLDLTVAPDILDPVNYLLAKAGEACPALMLMLNITQKRLIDDWLIDKSLPSRLYCYNEEDVDCKSKPYNCCFFLRSAFLAITKLCFQGFTGQKQLFSAVQTIYQRTVNNISYKVQKATYYIMSLLLL